MKNTGERLIPGYLNKTAIEHLHRYAFTIEIIRGKTVLDIASGEGYGSNLLSNYASKVVGVDISMEAVDHANLHYGKENLTFFQGDVLNIPFESNFFDVIVSFETLEHISDHEQMILEFKRVLKDDGILVISTPEKSIYSDSNQFENPFHEKELYEEEFKSLLTSKFQFNSFFYQRFFSNSLISKAKDVSKDLFFISGNFEGFNFNQILEQEYTIAVCSNSKTFDHIPSTLFTLYENNRIDIPKKNSVVNGFRYRFIDYVFKPWDLYIKKFFK